jgi:hypothetical protein
VAARVGQAPSSARAEGWRRARFPEVRRRRPPQQPLNHPAPRPAPRRKAHSFELDLDTTKFGEYVRGGIVTQFKPAKTLAFKSLAEVGGRAGGGVARLEGGCGRAARAS